MFKGGYIGPGPGGTYLGYMLFFWKQENMDEYIFDMDNTRTIIQCMTGIPPTTELMRKEIQKSRSGEVNHKNIFLPAVYILHLCKGMCYKNYTILINNQKRQ